MLDKLSAPFPPNRVSWRVGSTTKDKKRGMALAYFDARDVMDRLDEVCGPAGWQCRYLPIGENKTCCEIGIDTSFGLVSTDGRGNAERIVNWVWKADGSGDTEFEGSKGAFSDAFKRAAVKWGIGRYLYELKAPWVEIVPIGKSYAIAESEMPKLQKLLPGSQAATAKGKQTGEAHGPLGISELKDRLKAFNGDLATCIGERDPDQLNALISSHKAILEQCERDLPKWYFTQPNSDVLGIQQRIADAVAKCNTITHS